MSRFSTVKQDLFFNTTSHSENPTILVERVKQPENVLTIFGCLWAIFTAFHMESFIIRHHSFDDFVLIMLVAYFLSNPSSLLRFMLLICCQLYVIAVNQPFVPNHWLLAGFVDLTIVVSYVILMLKDRNFSINKGELFETFAPIVRVQLLILYFYVVFHKLNFDFLLPDFSCGSVFYEAQSNSSFLPSSEFLTKSNIYLTLLIEALIPVLLCFRGTLLLGLFIGVAFHAIIGYNPLQPFYDISSSIFALYFLFLPLNLVNEVVGYWKNTKIYQSISALSKIKYSAKSLFRVALISILSFSILFAFNMVFVHFFRFVLWTVYCVFCVGFILTALLMRQKKWVFQQNLFSTKYIGLWLIPVVVFINGASPYLGLKTDSSFSMFSNLRTEGNQTNHLFVPVSTQIFDFQKDMVEVIESSDPKIQRLADEHKLMAFFEMRRYVGSAKPFSVSYIRQGKRVDVANTSTSAEFAQPLPFWQKRLFQFRTISKSLHQPCAH